MLSLSSQTKVVFGLRIWRGTCEEKEKSMGKVYEIEVFFFGSLFHALFLSLHELLLKSLIQTQPNGHILTKGFYIHTPGDQSTTSYFYLLSPYKWVHFMCININWSSKNKVVFARPTINYIRIPKKKWVWNYEP